MTETNSLTESRAPFGMIFEGRLSELGQKKIAEYAGRYPGLTGAVVLARAKGGSFEASLKEMMDIFGGSFEAAFDGPIIARAREDWDEAGFSRETLENLKALFERAMAERQGRERVRLTPGDAFITDDRGWSFRLRDVYSPLDVDVVDDRIADGRPHRIRFMSSPTDEGASWAMMFVTEAGAKAALEKIVTQRALCLAPVSPDLGAVWAFLAFLPGRGQHSPVRLTFGTEAEAQKAHDRMLYGAIAPYRTWRAS